MLQLAHLGLFRSDTSQCLRSRQRRQPAIQSPEDQVFANVDSGRMLAPHWERASLPVFAAIEDPTAGPGRTLHATLAQPATQDPSKKVRMRSASGMGSAVASRRQALRDCFGELSAHKGRMGGLPCFNPLGPGAPAHARHVARGDVVGIHELLELLLLAPSREASVHGVREDRAHRAEGPTGGVAVRVSQPVVRCWRRDTVRSQLPRD